MKKDSTSGETRGRKKQFCSRSCAEQFARTRQRLDEAIDELVSALDSEQWTARQERQLASLLRGLLDQRSLYVTPAEFLAVTLDDVEHVGDFGKRPTAGLIRGWLHRPRPRPEVACRRCSGTGEDERGRRLGRLRGHRIADRDARDMVRDVLWQIASHNPGYVLSDWYRMAEDWANSRPKHGSER
ncbi:hypothetical protein [Nocardioides sp. zg-DK7169]|uniref:hypothetical protein n=1 Tax=Nocardioides sp. zg-DK7169 TaxID=2736600 RepID=UPI001552CDAD|nr:hypothetical protein [Nocardioides sp. zg-DK7169]NPC98738.1 hypothetical protein [Nocardioides sp. zg-DK7169]